MEIARGGEPFFKLPEYLISLLTSSGYQQYLYMISRGAILADKTVVFMYPSAKS